MPHSPQADDASRQRLQRGLARSTAGLLVLLALTAFGAAFAAYLSVENHTHATSARERLYQSLVAQARAERLGNKIGSRTRALDAIASAAAIRPSDALRDEAIVNLTRTDLAVTKQWPLQTTPELGGHFAFSSELDRYAVASANSVNVYQIDDTSKPLSIPVGASIDRISFSPRPNELNIILNSGITLLWDLNANAERTRIAYPSQESRANNVAFSRDGTRIVVAAPTRGTVFIHDSSSGELVHQHDGIPAPVATAVGTGATLAVSSGTDILWFKTEDAAPVRFPTGVAVNIIDVSADNSKIAFGGTSGSVGIIDTTDGNITLTTGHGSFIDGLKFSPDGQLLNSSSWSGVMRFWESRTGALLVETNQATGFHYDTTGSRLGFVGASGKAGIWKLERSPVHQVISTRQAGLGRGLNLDLSPDNRYLTVSDSDDVGTRVTCLFDRRSGQLLKRSTQPAIFGAKFTGTPGTAVASTIGIHALQFERRDDATVLTSSQPFTAPPAGLYFALQRVPGSRHQFSCLALDGSESLGIVVDSNTPTAPPLVVRGAPPEYKEGHFVTSPDLRYGAFTLWNSHSTEVWDLREKRLIRKLADHGGDAEFSTDGRLLVGATHAAYHFWQSGTWEELATIPRGVANSVFSNVSLSPDSRYAAINKTRELTQLVDLQDFSVAASLQLADPSITTNYVFSDDGQTLAASQLGRIVLWDIPALRRSLAGLGLPLGTAPVSSPATPSTTSTIAAAAIGVAVAILFGLFIFRYQHRLAQRLVNQYTELQHTREQLLQGEKMQALGTLSAGIAHDFRNLLSVIGLSNGLLKRAVKDDPDLTEETDAIQRAVNQGDKVVRSMLGFTRTSNATSTNQVDVADLIENTAAMLGQHFLSGIHMAIEIDPDLPPGKVPRSQLEQVLLNLVVNAADAMRGSGTLTLTATAIGPTGLPKDSILAPGPATTYIAITVTDTGPGIPADVIPQIFDPFFTTKHQGATPGTGLGLSTVHTSCTRTGTGIHLASPLSGGTTVTLHVPA